MGVIFSTPQILKVVSFAFLTPVSVHLVIFTCGRLALFPCCALLNHQGVVSVRPFVL
jgi:hypothetical protein